MLSGIETSVDAIGEPDSDGTETVGQMKTPAMVQLAVLIGVV